MAGHVGHRSNGWCIVSAAALLSLSLAACAGHGAGEARIASSWRHQAHVSAPHPGFADRFAQSVALSGDTLVIGASSEDSQQTTITSGASVDDSLSDSGAAYVFVRRASTWNLQATVKAPDAREGDRFGYHVAISGDTLVVGATEEDGVASDAGAAYVFTRSDGTWRHGATLKAPNAGAGDQFGWGVSISGDTVVVSAPYEDSAQTTVTHGLADADDNTAPDAGAVYVFVRGDAQWRHQATLKASNAGRGDRFGYSMAVEGDTVVVGAVDEDNSAADAGAAYVFARSGGRWALQAHLKGSTAGEHHHFGNSVALSGDTLAVGAPGETTSATGGGEGAVYVYTRSETTWRQQAYLKAAQADEGDGFGVSVAIEGDTLVVGASGEASHQTTVTDGSAASTDNSAPYAGAAYVYTRSGSSWVQHAYLKSPHAHEGDTFGFSVALSAQTIAVGAMQAAAAQAPRVSRRTGRRIAGGEEQVEQAGAADVFHLGN